jgi:hypothetical protein
MTCHDARERFSALVDDALEADTRAGLDAHLATCGDCRRELQRFRDTLSLLHGVAPVRAPAGFVDRVLEAARPAPWPRRLARGLFLPWPVKLPMEAAAIVLVAVGVALVYRGTPELQQAARLEAPAPGRAAELERTAPPAFAPAPPREIARENKLEGAREQGEKSEPAERRLGKMREIREAPAAPKATEPTPRAGMSRDEERSRDVEARQGTDAAAATPKDQAAAAASRSTARQSAQAARPAPGVAALAPATPPPASAGAGSASAASDVLGQLEVSDRDAALRQVGELITRLGATENGRIDGADGPIVDLTVPREAYAELTRELARLGRWRTSREPATLPAQVRVVLRIVG